MSYIYCIKERNTDKIIYIGQTKRDPKKRMNEHFKDIENNRHKIKKLNTYKVEDLDFEVLSKVNTDNSLVLSFLEMLYISKYKPINKCICKGFKGSQVTFARCNNIKLVEKLIEDIENCC